jgi:hypothetical protein
MLLNAFLNEYMVSELFVALPLNENGAAAFAADPLAAFKAGNTPQSAAAMLCLTLTNFRAKVIAPTASEYSAGRSLEVVTFYFELNLPPTGMSSTNATDLWTWTLPFSNDAWKRGNALFQHQAGSSLKVKMMWPLYQDATTFCQFAGDFKVWLNSSLFRFCAHDIDIPNFACHFARSRYYVCYSRSTSIL